MAGKTASKLGKIVRRDVTLILAYDREESSFAPQDIFVFYAVHDPGIDVEKPSRAPSRDGPRRMTGRNTSRPTAATGGTP